MLQRPVRLHATFRQWRLRLSKTIRRSSKSRGGLAAGPGMLESDYTHAELPKPPPQVPVRVFRRSQLTAALRQKVRPIVIEDPDLARPFARLLRARALPLKALGGLVAETMSYALKRYCGADIEAHWYIGQYVLPGNVQKVILKPKAVPLRVLGTSLSASYPSYRQ